MRMKKFGFWQETGFPNTPSIYSCINKNVQQPRKLGWFISFYLHNSIRMSTAMSYQESVIDGTRISGEVVLTDGTWVWTENIIFYYEQHGLILPEDFLKHIKRRLLPYPWIFVLKMLFWRKKIDHAITERMIKDFEKE